MADSVSGFVKKAMGTNPVQVEKCREGEFVVTFLNWTVAKKAPEMHGRKIRGMENSLKIREVQPKLTVDQCFDLICRRLEARERGDHYKGGGKDGNQSRQDRWRSPTRDPRYVRVADAEESPKRQDSPDQR